MTFALCALDITLNDRHLALISGEALDAHASPSPQGQKTLLLSSLYPWMDSLIKLAVQFGSDTDYRELPQFDASIWETAMLVKNSNDWELHAGGQIFDNLKRIDLYGEASTLPKLRIWSAAQESLAADIDSAMTLRGMEIAWKTISRPANLLRDPPLGILPHVILLEDLDLIDLLPDLADYKMIAGSTSQWLGLTDDNSGETDPLPLLNTYSPESPLYWMLAENPKLFSPEKLLPESLTMFLQMTLDNTILHSTDPLNRLVRGGVITTHPQSLSQWSMNNSAIKTVSPPQGAVNLQRIIYAAIPSNLNGADKQIAKRLLTDLKYDANHYSNVITSDSSNTTVSSEPRPIPIDKRTLLFYRAYERIGPLVISGQMDLNYGVELIAAYINGEE